MRGKYDKAAARVQEERLFADEQLRLHEKYDEADENVVIKEKDNMAKFLIRLLLGFLKLCFVLTVLALTTIGLLTIIYLWPEFKDIFGQIIGEITGSAYGGVLYD